MVKFWFGSWVNFVGCCVKFFKFTLNFHRNFWYKWWSRRTFKIKYCKGGYSSPKNDQFLTSVKIGCCGLFQGGRRLYLVLKEPFNGSNDIRFDRGLRFSNRLHWFVKTVWLPYGYTVRFCFFSRTLSGSVRVFTLGFPRVLHWRLQWLAKLFDVSRSGFAIATV